MTPEEEFLQNAYTMADFASRELKQFLTWNNQQQPFDQQAAAIRTQLEGIVSDISQLRAAYKNRG